MHDPEPKLKQARKSRQWWAVTDDNVRLVTGYSCGPNNPDIWWCPEVGFSMAEKHHLFATEAEALEKLIGGLVRRKTEIAEILSALRARLSSCTTP